MVFGSGGRLRDERAIFVSSGTTVDRLQTLNYPGGVWVSNSLVCLLTVTDAKPDLTNSFYNQQFNSIIKGLKEYKRDLKVSAGTVQLTYFNNLQWNGETLSEVEKPNEMKDFSSFTKYYEFLLSSLKKISTNMSTKGRMFPYKMLGTLSSGYDSSTNTVLAHQIGLNKVISFTTARGGHADDGKEIADFLGIQLTLIPRNRWRSQNLVEVPFIAADAKGGDVFFSAAEEFLRDSVLLTGFHGDKVWAKETSTLDSSIVRGDRSGLSLTEYRLLTGFIHLALPFMGVRQIEDINKISNSEEMKPWDIPGNYSRPICRRIVEEAGIQRNHFGIKKKATAVLLGSSDEIPSLIRENISHWLHENKSVWQSKSKASPYTQVKLIERFDIPLRLLKKGIRIASRISPTRVKSYLLRLFRKLNSLNRDAYLIRYAFPWAIEKAKENYMAYYKFTDRKEESKNNELV